MLKRHISAYRATSLWQRSTVRVGMSALSGRYVGSTYRIAAMNTMERFNLFFHFMLSRQITSCGIAKIIKSEAQLMAAAAVFKTTTSITQLPSVMSGSQDLSIGEQAKISRHVKII